MCWEVSDVVKSLVIYTVNKAVGCRRRKQGSAGGEQGQVCSDNLAMESPLIQVEPWKLCSLNEGCPWMPRICVRPRVPCGLALWDDPQLAGPR